MIEEGSECMMKTIVLYLSHTGRTQKIAEQVASGLPEGTPCLPIEEIPADISSYDCVFLGYCANGENIEAETSQIIEKLNNKNIAVFVTVSAGPFSDDSSKILRAVIETLPAGCNVVGTYVTPTEKEGDPEEIDQDARRFAKEFAINTMARLLSGK